MFTEAILREALFNEYEYLCHDDYDPDEDMSPEDYKKWLETLTFDELVEETSTDDVYYPLADYVNFHYRG